MRTGLPELDDQVRFAGDGEFDLVQPARVPADVELHRGRRRRCRRRGSGHDAQVEVVRRLPSEVRPHPEVLAAWRVE